MQKMQFGLVFVVSIVSLPRTFRDCRDSNVYVITHLGRARDVVFATTSYVSTAIGVAMDDRLAEMAERVEGCARIIACLAKDEDMDDATRTALLLVASILEEAASL